MDLGSHRRDRSREVKGVAQHGSVEVKKVPRMEIAPKPLVMASEIAVLDSHRTYIRHENRVVPVRFRLAKKRKKHAAFIERKRETPASRNSGATVKPVPEQPAPQESVQVVLPLDEAPVGRRQGFVGMQVGKLSDDKRIVKNLDNRM